MRYVLHASLGLMLLYLTAIPTTALRAQERPVTDFTETIPPPEALVESLRPEIPPPPLSRSMGKPTCIRFHQQVSRGIRPAPVSENIALRVEFESNSATLTPKARQVLDSLAQALQSPVLKDCCFRIEGHTDSEHTEEYNQRLSADRARAVATYLHEQSGIELDRLLQDARGESQPLAPNNNSAGRQKNRRVQVTTLGYRTVEDGP